MAQLSYQRFRGGREIIKLGNDLVSVGRSRNCTIPLPHDTNTSRRHAEIKLLPDGNYVVKDLESKNGTFVNEAPISTWVLKPGDRIRIGNCIITFSK